MPRIECAERVDHGVAPVVQPLHPRPVAVRRAHDRLDQLARGRLVVAGALLLVAFAAIESRVSAPKIALSLFRSGLCRRQRRRAGDPARPRWHAVHADHAAAVRPAALHNYDYDYDYDYDETRVVRPVARINRPVAQRLVAAGSSGSVL